MIINPSEYSSLLSGGVVSHSSPAAYERFVIFAVAPGLELQLEEFYRARFGAQIKALTGSWKGIEERSFIVPLESFSRSPFLRSYLVGQESILILGPLVDKLTATPRGARLGELVYLNANGEEDYRVPCGSFRAETPEYAQAQDGWTYDPASGTFYVCH